MKKPIIPLLFAGLAVGCSGDTPTGAEVESLNLQVVGNSGPSANGQATLPLELLGGRQTLSFHAREAKDGTVSGSVEVKSRGQDARIHATIDCLVIDGNEAILGGVFTQVRLGPDSPLPPGLIEVGGRLWFKVRDNGEGGGAGADQFSDVFPVPDFIECDDFEVPLIPIEVGNIQVKP